MKKVFVSYDHSEDVHYKYLLQAWDANTDFDFEFDNESIQISRTILFFYAIP